MNSHQRESTVKNGGHYYADEDRAQRHSLCLRNVSYVIEAQIELRSHANDDIAKYRDQFRRRVKKGQCHHQPYLGTRECSAFFEDSTGHEQPINHSEDLGLMLYDMEFSVFENGPIQYVTHAQNGAVITKGIAKPKFFHAYLVKGILSIPRL
jgi:CRISPR-associated protein Cas5d